ncbi:winged helix-turn-helix transcriptional regulator [Streptomyces beihaiensis]|uniref:Helix-turn-helix transcriptional regulator n=1 Tax=Streptomyces beihaiensis TaxID=2984495 RepID=A0ABT3U102_9ACTN|nr:helix-turn-helix domain-containing protein [Streptomyces beihaiensis]MCX3062996.1 helix-turn-helix transcriptional regulator [Streptomyces beihaiensis]
MPRRSYDQFCAVARALDAVGDRWTLLIVRELLAGPRRYTDLHADLPGVSTDMLATRLKDMEQGGLAERRRLSMPASAYVYELTARGRGLLPVLQALGEWGAPGLAERRPTDAVRAHWLALPLLRDLERLGEPGIAEVSVDEGVFHVRAAAAGGEPVYGDGRYTNGEPDVRLTLDAEVCREVAQGAVSLTDAARAGRVRVEGAGALAKGLLGAGTGRAAGPLE